MGYLEVGFYNVYKLFFPKTQDLYPLVRWGGGRGEEYPPCAYESTGNCA